MAQQDDYFYEIQLTNKQLVFYFMAGATGLVLSFLAGVMVGRGVDAGSTEVQAARPPVQEEKVVTEETLKPVTPAAEDLGYAQRLESDRVDDSLARARPAVPEARGEATRPAPSVAPPVRSAPLPTPTAAPASAAAAAPSTAAGTFTIQVGAFKDKEGAESVLARLKRRGFDAYVIAPGSPDGLYNVRVGSYTARDEAERVSARLRDAEKFKPFIVKN